VYSYNQEFRKFYFYLTFQIYIFQTFTHKQRRINVQDYEEKKINNMNHELKKQSKREIFIICFKIKNPPTLHSTLKIQPTTSPTFVFSVSASVRKRWVTKENCWDSRFGRTSSCFLFSFYYFTQKV
jgi:hypothetical protein